jgi:ABC-type Fe3+-citrate transport system substrate-binding protein
MEQLANFIKAETILKNIEIMYESEKYNQGLRAMLLFNEAEKDELSQKKMQKIALTLKIKNEADQFKQTMLLAQNIGNNIHKERSFQTEFEGITRVNDVNETLELDVNFTVYDRVGLA